MLKASVNWEGKHEVCLAHESIRVLATLLSESYEYGS